ncbi:hypothetical protein L1887_34902 [Cichorium endivia]|nr:hypothetical protein L1887_34902 [Cichorium endivia]
MAAVKTNGTMTTIQAKTNTTAEPVRPLARFPPSVWGDRFLSFTLDNSELDGYARAMEEPKEDLTRLITDATMESNKKLSLIYSVHRLGLTYLFLQEIESQLDKLFEEFNLQDYVDLDLYTLSINFQVFRHLGYKLPCDVFNKIKDSSSGAFKEDVATDVKGDTSFEKTVPSRDAPDDTYDAYATIEEIRLLTDAINRWDMSAMEQIPEYIRPFYKILLDEYAELEKQLAIEGRANIVIASKEAFQDIARGYLEEAEWTNSGSVASFPEYMKNGLITSGIDLLFKSVFLGMGEIISENELAWYKSHPKTLQACELITRLEDDVMTYQFERERGQSATSVDAYIKTYGVSEKEAIDELKIMIENARKDINEGCLKPREVSMDLLAPILNVPRMLDVIYRYDDGFTFPGKSMKEYITLLFVGSVTETGRGYESDSTSACKQDTNGINKKHSKNWSHLHEIQEIDDEDTFQSPPFTPAASNSLVACEDISLPPELDVDCVHGFKDLKDMLISISNDLIDNISELDGDQS